LGYREPVDHFQSSRIWPNLKEPVIKPVARFLGDASLKVRLNLHRKLSKPKDRKTETLRNILRETKAAFSAALVSDGIADEKVIGAYRYLEDWYDNSGLPRRRSSLLHAFVLATGWLREGGWLREAEIELEICASLLIWLPHGSAERLHRTYGEASVEFERAKLLLANGIASDASLSFSKARRLFQLAKLQSEGAYSSCDYMAACCVEGRGDAFAAAGSRRAHAQYVAAADAMRKIVSAVEPEAYLLVPLYRKAAASAAAINLSEKAILFSKEAQLISDTKATKEAFWQRQWEARLARTGVGSQHLLESKNVVDLERPVRRESAVAPVGREADVTTDLPKKPSKLFVARQQGKKSREQQAVADLEVVNFIKEVYGPYYEKHRTKLLAYIREHDPALFNAIRVLKRNNRMPAAVYLPSRTEALEELVQKAAKDGLKSLSEPERRSIRGAISRHRKPSPN
jgi:hypothetical protein